jgi:hypothetical protein
MAICLDASKNQDLIEEQEKQEMTDRGEVPEEFMQVKKRKIQQSYIPPEELARLEEVYSKVVVQDFEDDYHMTKVEREQQKIRFAKFYRLRRGYTKKIRRLDKYIEACRLVVEIILDTAESNGVMDPDEFVRDVLTGKIKIAGLQIPKYQGKGRKTLNWDYVTEFILDSSRNIDELLKNQSTSKCKEVLEAAPITADDMKAEMGEEAYENMLESIRSYRPPAQASFDEGDKGVVTVETRKQRKALAKSFPGYEKIIKDMREDSRREKAYIWQIQESDLKWIREFQDERDRKLGDVRPEFTGSIMDEDAVARYMFEVEQWEKQHNLVKYGENTITEAQRDELEYRRVLEENGYNLRNLYGNKERQKRIEKKRAEEKKKIKSLKKMLTELKSKQENHGLEGLNGKIEAYNADAINKKMKKKKKVSKKAKKKAKAFDSILLDATGANDKSMKAYEKRMKNMSWEKGGD